MASRQDLDWNNLPNSGHQTWSRAIPSPNVSLTKNCDRFVKRIVTSDQYRNASKVVRDGSQLLEQKVPESKLKPERLREHDRAPWFPVGAALGTGPARFKSQGTARAVWPSLERPHSIWGRR